MKLFIVYFDTGMDDFQLLGIYNDKGAAEDDLEDYMEKFKTQDARRFYCVEPWDIDINTLRNN